MANHTEGEHLEQPAAVLPLTYIYHTEYSIVKGKLKDN